MADNVAITAGSGTSVAADDIGSVFHQRVKLSLGADGTAVDAIAGAGVVGTGVQRVTIATDDAVPVALAAIQATGKTCSTSVTRPADTTAYAANDALSDSTSAPTSGGFTFTSAARQSGGTGIITDILVSSSADPATLLQGEIWIADQAMTNINDNSAFAMADADVLNLVAVIPFALQTTVAGSGTNSYAHLTGLGIGYTCVGSANLRFLIKVKNAYTPISAEVLQVRLKCQYTS